MRVIYRDIVGAFIFSKDGYLLLGKSNRGTYEGMWLVPGGGIEDGESKEQALIREIKGEVGLDLSESSLEYMNETLTGESIKILKETEETVLGKYTFYNFVINLDTNHENIDVSSMDDFTGAMWHSIESLKDLPLPPPTITTLKKLGYL